MAGTRGATDTTASAPVVPPGGATPRPAGRRRHSNRIRRDGLAGWLFLAPAILVLGSFLVLPVLMAAWVSLSDWNGNGSPLASGVDFVGADNYTAQIGRAHV